ncbi:hypothetical protein CYMTET_13819 [Cymbomonas tetramitiformis]|uniref:Integrase catalytic domain-containing protein n=1 Tax=Cymbomonas tetramitiformis TaxID=36881 RepID=A0AAE0GHA7_9CHLO|nr:hypothetical protein CYMTET_13819 [Cymbomonas tetramitiformis]
MEKSDLQGQHLRWAISLQEFDFTVQYRPGAKNSNADVPSPYPLPSTMDETGARHEREKVANYCKMVAREQLGTGPVHRLFDLHHQEELECDHTVMFDTDQPELVVDSGRLARAAWKALSLVRPTRGTHREGTPAVYSSEHLEGERILKPEKVDTRVLDKQFFSRRAREEGVVCYEPCGGLCAGLEMLLRNGMKVTLYLYQDISTSSQAVARERYQFRSVMGKVARPEGRFVSSIICEGWQPRPVVRSDRTPHYMVNVVEEPLRALPTIMATQGSRAFRAPRLGTVVRSAGADSEEETREVNLDEKSRAMGYNANELRMADGLSDEELASILGLDMDRRAMELLLAVAEASRKGLPHSEESPVAENSPGQPVAVDNNWADHAWSDLQQRQALLAKWVGNSNAYTQQRSSTKKKPWQLYIVEQYNHRHKSRFMKEGGAQPRRTEVPAWGPPGEEKEMRLPRLTCTTRLTELVASVAEQHADRDKHRDIHDDEWTGHRGIRRTTQHLLWQRHWWADLKKDVEAVVTQCEACQRVKTHYAREEAVLSPLEIVSFMYRWSLDLAWPSRRVTRSGNSRVLIMTEHYTRFIVCVPIPNKEASTIAAAFRNHVLAVFGAPAECLVDGGKEFEGEFEQLCRDCLYPS